MADTTFYEPGEPILCAKADEGCKARYYRPQEAAEALSTETIAQLHGWKVADADAGTLNCPMHTS
jgi:hypothetical protein